MRARAAPCRLAPADWAHFAAPVSRARDQIHDPRSTTVALRRSSRLFGAAVAFAAVAATTEPRADELSPDHAAIYMLQDENASISSSGLTDRY